MTPSNDIVADLIRAAFLKKVRHVGECWIWPWASKEGYGRIDIIGKHVQAHRLSWMLFRGPIPEGLEVCHNCPGGDNRLCVNPDHLFVATHLENVRDGWRKGRYAHVSQAAAVAIRGESNQHAKLTEAQVISIRARHAAGERQCDLAREFGVHRNAIYRLTSGISWKHVHS